MLLQGLLSPAEFEYRFSLIRYPQYLTRAWSCADKLLDSRLWRHALPYDVASQDSTGPSVARTTGHRYGLRVRHRAADEIDDPINLLLRRCPPILHRFVALTDSA